MYELNVRFTGLVVWLPNDANVTNDTNVTNDANVPC